LAGIPSVIAPIPGKKAGNLADIFSTVTSWAQRCVGILRLKEFDSSTPEGRSRERYRRAALTALSSAGAKVVAVITILIAVPLTLHYLGTERYGMWMTISSIIAMMGFADLGMGLGLLNTIAEAHGLDDRQAAVNYVSSGFFMLSGVALLILLVFAVAYPFIPWHKVFNVKSPQAIREAGPAMGVFIACFAISMPLGVVQQVQLGYQEGFINSIWESAGRVVGLVGLLLVIYLKAGLVWLVLAMAGAPALAWLVNSLVLFGRRRPWLCPQWHLATFSCAKRIFRIGILFFLLQIVVSVAFASDNLVAAQVLGSEAVAQYSIPSRVFSMTLLISTLLIGPLWPAYGEALARGDIPWVERTLKRSLTLIVFLVGIPSIVLIAIGSKVIHLWVGSAITPSFLLLLGLGIWTIMSALGHALAMFFNGANILRIQVICGFIMAISGLLLKIWLAKTIGLPGIVWGTVIAFFFCCLVPYAFYVPRLLSNLRNSSGLTNT
jgi:O-antigen/teichoic acid export membrane protein